MSEAPGGPALTAFNWGMVTRSLARPYRVPVSMILLFAMVPFYVLIPELLPPRTRHVPELALDRALPLIPSWAIVYGAQWLIAALSNKGLLPAHTKWVAIEGGNHSQFGHYGHQLFDGAATISRGDQQKITRTAVLEGLADAP